MKTKLTIVGVVLAAAVIVSLIPAAIVAGSLAFCVGWSFWPTFGYAMMGVITFNVGYTYRNYWRKLSH